MQTGLQSDVFLVQVTALWSAEQKGFLLVLFSHGLSYQLTLMHAVFLLKIWQDTNGIFKMSASGERKNTANPLPALFLYRNAVLASSVFVFFPVLLAALLKLWDTWRKHWLVTTTVAFIIWSCYLFLRSGEYGFISLKPTSPLVKYMAVIHWNRSSLIWKFERPYH